MIYEKVNSDDPIQQGDIFHGVPRIDLSLSDLTIIDEEDEAQITNWRTVLSKPNSSEGVSLLLPVKPVNAVIITQNCDVVRGRYIYLCQIDDFSEATGGQAAKNANGWQSLITRLARTNPRLFYLPPAADFGFSERRMADFRIILRIPRTDLEEMRDIRVARLNSVATEHLREALGHYFRRFAYNEWYPLDREEFQAYAGKSPQPIEPYHWQQ